MTLSTLVRSAVPRPVKDRIKAVLESARRRSMFGRFAPLVPPERLMHDGPPTYEAFKSNADEFYRIYIDLCRLSPHENMLDVGCGIGRKAYRLTDYLRPPGSFDGIDIVRPGIDWLTRTYSRRHPNFRFQIADVLNTHYNPSGRHRASEYRFPFGDAAFDFVALGSVFTHMLPPDMEQYLSEIRRVLRPGGRCLISWFLIDDDVRKLLAAGRSTQALHHRVADHCWTSVPEDPEQAIGFEEDYVREQYRARGFDIADGIHRGSWCGRDRFLSYQDLVLARVPR